MVLGVEGVNPPAWRQRLHSPFFQLIMFTYLEELQSKDILLESG